MQQQQLHKRPAADHTCSSPARWLQPAPARFLLQGKHQGLCRCPVWARNLVVQAESNQGRSGNRHTADMNNQEDEPDETQDIYGNLRAGHADRLPAAGTTTNVRDSGSGPGMTDAKLAAYDGPQARIAVARFENKTGASGKWWNTSIGDGMADMLTTALFNSGRFIVLERQAVDDVISEQDLGASGRVRGETAAAIGEIEGAELLVVAAVTEFDENTSGTRGSATGSRIGRIVGSISGGSSSAHMAIDLRIIDTNTSRILAATSVEGKAKDFDIGGALAGYTGRHSLGGALSSWENTPREKALRQVIGAAVEEISRD